MFANGDCDVMGASFPGCAASATSYAALDDLDAVAAATPPYGAPYSGTWTIPATLAAGDYALFVEVNKEFDNNAAHTHPSYTDPQLAGYGLTNNFGQPSVVYRMPIHIDTAAGAGARPPRPRSPDTATGRAGAARSPRVTRRSRRPIPDRARRACSRSRPPPAPDGCTSASSRADRRTCTPPPPPPGIVSRSRPRRSELTDTTAVVSFKNAESDGGGAVASYEIRYREGDSMSDQEFVESIRAARWSRRGAPGSTATLTLAGLKPATDYVVGVRAVDTCGQTSPLAQVGFATAAPPFKQIEGCFVATAAWGSALRPQVEALRRARDHARSGNAMAAVAVDLYYRSGPAAAAVVRRSETARAAVRRLLSPVAGTATLLF